MCIASWDLIFIYDSHQTEDQEDAFFWATQMHALTPPSAAVCGPHGAGTRRPGTNHPPWCDDCYMAEDNGHHGHQDQAKAIHLFLAIFFRTSELLSQCFSACFCVAALSEGPTPNRKTWPISHWLFVVAGKSWKGVLAISSASTGCLGRILKWRRRMSDWNSV